MWNQQEQASGMRPSHVVAAVFLDEVSARDAIADLKLAAASRASQDRCRSVTRGQAATWAKPGRSPLPSDLEGKHSVLWRVRHSIKHDVHSHEGSVLIKPPGCSGGSQ